MTTFSDLPNEIIVQIFKYLSVADQYESFFDSNKRLRALLKRWMPYSRQGFQRDFIRFCTLHSWYKISLAEGGRLCFLYPRRGEQSRARRAEENDERRNLHWWFIFHGDEPKMDDERVRSIVARHAFRFSPFCYGYDSSTQIDSRFSSVLSLIVSRDRPTHLATWLTANYPEHADRIINADTISTTLYQPIIEAERLKTWTAVSERADRIWQELRALDDVNPLDITAYN